MEQSGNCVRVKFVCGAKKKVEFLPVPLNFQEILNQVLSVFGFQRFCLHFRNINILVPLNNETDLEYIWHLFQLRKDRKQRFDVLVTPLREDGSLRFGDDSADEYVDGRYYNQPLSDIPCEFQPDYGEDCYGLECNNGANTGAVVHRRPQSSLTRALSSPQSSIGSSSSSGSVSSNNIASTAAALLGAPNSASPPTHSTSRGGGLFIPEDDDDAYFCDTPRSGYAASVSGGSYNSLISNSSSVQNISSHNNSNPTDAIHSPPLVDHLSGRHLSVRSGTSGSNNSETAQRNQFVYESCSVISPGVFAGSHPSTDFVLDDRENNPTSLLYSQGVANAQENHSQIVGASFDGSLDDETQLHDFNSRANALGLTVQTNCADLLKTPQPPNNNSNVSSPPINSHNTLTGGSSSGSSSVVCPRSHGTYPRAKTDSPNPGTICPDPFQLTPVSKNTTPYNRPVVWNSNGSACSRKVQQGLTSSDMNLNNNIQSQKTGVTSTAKRSVVTCFGSRAKMTSTPIGANNTFFFDRDTTSPSLNNSSRSHCINGHRRTNSRATITDPCTNTSTDGATDTSGISSGGTNSDLSADDVSTCSQNLSLSRDRMERSSRCALSSLSDLDANSLKQGVCKFDGTENMDLWVKGSVIGSGGFGTVRHYYNKENGVERAVKEIQLTDHTPEKTLVQAQNEIHCLTQLSHERIVKFCGTGMYDYKILIFMELMPGGSVKDQIESYGPLTESVCRKYLVQILDGLIYLHNAMIIHRDLKCANILRDGNGFVKLSDFGCAKMLAHVRRHSGSVDSKSCTGSAYWMSPEVILNERYTRKADVWSLGCTAVEMVTGKAPNANKEALPAMYCLVAERGCTPQFPEGSSEQLKDFVTRSLTYEQLSRPSAQDLRHHEFLEGVHVARNSSSTK